MAKSIYHFLESAYKQYTENWCASRGYKLEDWHFPDGFNGESFVSFEEFCDNEFKEREVMQSILSPDDFKFWETLSKENIKIKTYKIPVTWEVYATVEIEATSLEEAVAIFKETEDDIPLPTDPDYVDGSFCLTTENLDEIRIIN